MKYCSECQFRAPDERVICLTCGSTKLIKVNFEPTAPTFDEKANAFIEQMRGGTGDALSTVGPVLKKVFNFVASSFVELQQSVPKVVGAFHKMRALLAIRLPESPPSDLPVRRRRNELVNAMSQQTYSQDNSYSRDEHYAPERSLPILLRDMSKHRR